MMWWLLSQPGHFEGLTHFNAEYQPPDFKVGSVLNAPIENRHITHERRLLGDCTFLVRS
jgi:hypothetical protein